MIFAAGTGSRMKPLTDITPKALIELNKKTLLERVIEKLKQRRNELTRDIHKSPNTMGILICVERAEQANDVDQ